MNHSKYKETDTTYQELNKEFNSCAGRPSKKQKLESASMKKEDIYNLIDDKNYEKLALVFSNEDLFKLIPDPMWPLLFHKDFDLLQLACKHINFIQYLSSYSSLLPEIAKGPEQNSVKDNRKFFDLINEFQYVMNDTTKTLMDSLYKNRGYENDDLPPSRPSFNL